MYSSVSQKFGNNAFIAQKTKRQMSFFHPISRINLNCSYILAPIQISNFTNPCSFFIVWFLHYDTHKKWCITQMPHVTKEYPKIICQEQSSVIFKRGILNLLYDSDSSSYDFIIE